MTGEELLSQLLVTFLRIQPTPKNLQLYDELQKSLSDFTIVDSFSQLTRGNNNQGLSLEILLFDKEKIIDIVISQSTINYITVVAKHVNMIFLETSYNTNQHLPGQASITDTLKLTISYGENQERTLYYLTETKRFVEINNLKNKLLNLISK